MGETDVAMSRILSGLAVFALSQMGAFAQSPCERYPMGSTVSKPEDLYSKDGVLAVDFTYQTFQDAAGKTYFCFINSDGAQSPTLHVRPGDVLKLTLTNLVPEQPGKAGGMPAMEMSKAGAGGCGAASMTASSVNIHYHGTNTPPICHQDEVIHTIINSGETFQYEVHFPKNEPPGLYWYHPHIHGLTRAAVQGGASGALIVDGIERVNRAVAGLPQRVLVVREEPPAPLPPDDEAGTDLSVNYVVIAGPAFVPAKISMKPGEKQFWRVVNSAAHTILDLQLSYDGIIQPVELIALDSVPLGSQDGSGRGKSVKRTHLLIPPAGRAEFIVTGPSTEVLDARLLTEAVTTGPLGDVDPTRTLLSIQTSATGAAASDITTIPAASGTPPVERFAGLAQARPTATRKLYFSEDDTYFYITVNGQIPKPFHMDDPPSIVTTQGSVEDWTIENRAQENHEFHMHQIHFLTLAQNGKALPPEQQQFLDTVNVPYWNGVGPYPSVTLRMDFRGPDVGDFVYHCHILDHEDAGMMAIIRVLPRASASASSTSKSIAAGSAALKRRK
jgi:FtsP/CotA-like multicopper oxidase with cupredoxin domain